MAVIETWLHQDLQEPVKVNHLDGNLFSNNGNGNRIGVVLTNNGEALASISGTVSGYVVTADGSTVPCTGSKSGNRASILIPAAAYQPGSIFITVFVTDGTTVTTIGAVSTTVMRSQTNAQVDPGSAVTDWTQTINAAMQSVETAAANLGGIVAVPYASITFPVPLGKYTYYNNNLYRCISPIASSESFTAAHWTQVRLGDEVSDLKSAITKEFITITPTLTTIQDYINSSTGAISGSSNSRCVYFKCEKNTIYKVQKTAGTRFVIGFTTVVPAGGVTCTKYIVDNTASVLEIISDSTSEYLVAFVWNSTTDTGISASDMINSIVIKKNNYIDEVARAFAEVAEDCKDVIDKNIIPFNNQINLYNGKGVVFGGWSGRSFALDSAHQKKTAVIKCEKNKQYWVVRNVASDTFGRIGTATEYPKAGTTITQLADIGGALSYNVTTGNDAEYLLFYYTYNAVDEFIQITDFQTTSLLQNTYPVLPDSVYTKKQVNDLISDVSQAKKCKFSKTGNSMSIYMPSPKSSKYMRFVYKLHTDNTINMNQWKVMDMNVCDSDLTVLFNLYSGTANNTEWEGVVRETGTADFIGGYHGDETNVFVSVMVDGVEINMSNDYPVMDCSDILIVNKSTVNRCNTPGTNLFTRYKVSHWTPKKYTIENRWIVLQSVSLDRVYMTMMSLPIQNGDKYIATYGRYNDGYVIQPSVGEAVSGSCLYNSKYATNVEMWGADFYARCTGKMDDNAIHIVHCDRSQTNIFKGYWWQYVVSGGQTFSANDELHGFSEYKFIF